MTPNMKAFAEAILEGSGSAPAYRLACNTEGLLSATIANNAYKLLRRDGVATMVA